MIKLNNIIGVKNIINRLVAFKIDKPHALCDCGLTAGPRTKGEVGSGKGRKAWTSGSGVEWIKTCVNILQLNR